MKKISLLVMSIIMSISLFATSGDIAGNFNNWNFTRMVKLDDIHYKCSGTAAFMDDAEYKYFSGNDWAYVEKNADGSEIGNRSRAAEDVVTAWAEEYIPTLQEVTAMAVNEETLAKGVVTYIRGKNAYIQDATAGMMLFCKATPTFQVGQEVVVHGTKTTYGGAPELKNVEEVSAEEGVMPTVKPLSSIAELKDNPLQYFGQLVSLKFLRIVSYNNYYTYLTDGIDTITCYGMNIEPTLFPVGSIVNAVAIASYYNGCQLVGDGSGITKVVVTLLCDKSKGVASVDGILSASPCQIIISATPYNGYRFEQWSDGVTDNPRTIILTQDTTFTAEFAINQYAVSLQGDEERGLVEGAGTFDYLTQITLSATPAYGYHFSSWSDGNMENPRVYTVTRDITLTANFVPNRYMIYGSCQAEQGSIAGVGSYDYFTECSIEAVPSYGYHFVQWSDGLKDNPRIVQLTQDTTFTAEFAYDRVGTCGKNLALVWSYDPTTKVLTIGNAGAFTENMQFGLEAPDEMEELVIGHNVTSIGNNAFSGIETLKRITIGESVKTIGEQAFYNCVNLETIYNYRATPTNAYSTAFDGVDKFECALYVLPNSINMYQNASVWRDFYYTYAIGATTTTTDEVSVTPAVNTVAVTWPAVENAVTYELEIKDKNGNIICTLIFNSNGQLTSIAFAAPSRAQTSGQIAGFSFTVTGLDSGTGYDLTITAKNEDGEVLNTATQSFTTTGGVTTALDDMDSTSPAVRKVIINGQLFITLPNGTRYTATGVKVE